MSDLIWTPSTTNQDEIEIPTFSIEGARENPLILYHHGLYGTKHGEHAFNVIQIAIEENCSFVSFDNLGHGTNTSIPLDQANMESWITTAKHMINEHALDRNIILVGNSFGASVLLHAVTELGIENQVVGFSGIGAIVDSIQIEMQAGLNSYFVPGIYRKKPILDANTQKQYEAGETVLAPYPVPDSPLKIPVSKSFFETARRYTLLKDNEESENGKKFTSDQRFQCYTYLHYGKKDSIVTEARTNELANAFRHSGATVYINELNQDDHNLHSGEAYQAIQFGIKQIVNAYRR